MSFRKFKMRFKSERNAVYEKLPPLQAGDVARKRERELNDFQAIHGTFRALLLTVLSKIARLSLLLRKRRETPLWRRRWKPPRPIWRR